MKKSLLTILVILTCFAQNTWAQQAGDVVYATTIEGVILKMKYHTEIENLEGWWVDMLQDASIEGTVTIPSVVEGHPVTALDGIAFANCEKITQVVIPSTVTSIGQGAFQYCKSLKDIIIPNGVKKLPRSLFQGCESLESFVLPSSVTQIEGGMFQYCTSLVFLSVEEGNTTFESPNNSNAIITKSGLLSCGCQTTVIPEEVTIIGEEAFMGCPFEAFEIPSGVTDIRRYAFSYCRNLKTITIPASVNSIGFSVWYPGTAFNGCEALTTVNSYIEEPFELDASDFQVYDPETQSYSFTTATLYVPRGTKAKYEALSPWNKFQSIVEMGESVEPIELNPIDNETTIDLAAEESTENVVANNVYYNLSGDDGYEPTEDCIVINTTTDMTLVDGEPGSETVKENFNGLIFQVNGKGVIALDCQTLGTNVLNVKVGSEDATTVSKDERGIVEVAYDVTEPTCVYVYATSAGGAAPRRVAASENCIKLWSLSVKPGATLCIGSVKPSALATNHYYTIDGRQLQEVPVEKGVYIVNGRKVVVK